MTFPELYQNWIDADQAWMDELTRKFEDSALHARYEERGSGKEGSELRKLYLACQKAREDALQAFKTGAIN